MTSSRREERSDEDLVAATARGDRQAAARLAERTYQQTFRSLVRLCDGDADLAADLTQETYRRAWRSLDRFRGRARFSTWLYRIAFNTFLNHRRRPHRLEPLDEERYRRRLDPAPDAEETTRQHERAAELRRLVARLPEDQRFAVAAVYWGDHSVKEVAAVEGVTPMAIRHRLRRAMRRLEAGLKEGSR